MGTIPVHPALFSLSSSPFQILSPKGADRHGKGGAADGGDLPGVSLQAGDNGEGAWRSGQEGVYIGLGRRTPLTYSITWGVKRQESWEFQSYLSPSREWCWFILSGQELHSQLVNLGTSKERGGENNHL